MNFERPKIMLVADHPNWAYDHVCKFIMRELNFKYDFYIDYLDLNRKTKSHRRKGWFHRTRHFIKYYNRRRLLPLNQKYDLICYLGWYFPHTGNFRFSAKGIIQGIYTDGFPPQSYSLQLESGISVREFVNKYIGRSASVAVGSMSIFNRYKPYIENLYYATCGEDLELFSPTKKRKRDKKSFVVGWTGNPQRPFKGFYDYVVPAVKRAGTLRNGISLKTRFRGPLHTLPSFYHKVDVMLIASIADAGPNCFLEAGACGVPSISTRVGAAADTIRDGENSMFVERSVDAMAKAIVYLYDNRELLRNMSIRIRRDFELHWNPKVRSKQWDQMFEETLKRACCPELDTN